MPEIKTNSLKAWLLASRPKTLTGAAVPVIIGLSMAMRDSGSLEIIPALLCLLFALLMQADANFVNDYFDWRRGNDDEATRLGPLRACSQGWVTSRAMIGAIFATTAVACAVGLPLVFYGGWEMVIVGVACVAFCVLYTTTFSYLAMGDVLVLAFFGIVPVCLTYYLQTGAITSGVFLASIACGLAVDNLLIVNNYRDIDNDQRDGKRTLIVFTGRRAGRALYLALGIAAAATISFVSGFSVSSLLMLLYLALHCKTYKLLGELQGRELNRVLGLTARNIFIFGLLSALVFLI